MRPMIGAAPGLAYRSGRDPRLAAGAFPLLGRLGRVARIRAVARFSSEPPVTEPGFELGLVEEAVAVGVDLCKLLLEKRRGLFHREFPVAVGVRALHHL